MLINRNRLKIKRFARSESKLGYMYALVATCVARKGAGMRCLPQREEDEVRALRAKIQACEPEINHGEPDRLRGVRK